MTAEEQVNAIENARELMANSWNQIEAPELKTIEKYQELIAEMDATIAAVIANDNTDGMLLPACPKCPPAE